MPIPSPEEPELALEPLLPFFIPLSNLKIETSSRDARGGFGIVRVATLLRTDGSPSQKVAVKEFASGSIPLRIAYGIAREMTVWSKLNHPNVLPFTGYHLSDALDIAYLVCPFIEQGNVRDYLQKYKLNPSKRASLVQDTVEGLKYLHSIKVCHGDLKSLNVLVTDGKRAMLCDFGLASIIHDDKPTALATSTGFKGTAWACLALEIMTGDVPYHDLREVAVTNWIMKKSTPASWTKSCKRLPKGMLGLWDLCWSFSPSVRPDAATCAKAWPVCWNQVKWRSSFLEGKSVKAGVVSTLLSRYLVRGATSGAGLAWPKNFTFTLSDSFDAAPPNIPGASNRTNHLKPSPSQLTEQPLTLSLSHNSNPQISSYTHRRNRTISTPATPTNSGLLRISFGATSPNFTRAFDHSLPDSAVPDQEAEELRLDRHKLDLALEPLKPLFIPLSNLHIEISSGDARGGYAIVHVATFSPSDGSPPVKVAVKELTDLGRALPLRIAFRIAREMTVWSKLDHPNVLPFTGYHLSYDMNIAYLVCPYLEEGNIKDYLRQHNPDYSVRAFLVQDTIEGLKYLHSIKVCHGDLKSLNVLITNNKRAMLCDFGLACVMQDQPTGLSTSTGFKGSFRWCSPELLENYPRNFLSDIWAWACLALEIVTGDFPYNDIVHDVGVLSWIMKGRTPASGTKSCRALPKGMLGLWDVCWSADLSARPDAATCATAWSVCWNKVEWHSSFLEGVSIQSASVDIIPSARPTQPTAAPRQPRLDLHAHTWQGEPLSNHGFSPISSTSKPRAPEITLSGSTRSTTLPRGRSALVPRPEGKICIGIDFGTTTSGVAYASFGIGADRAQRVVHWSGSYESLSRIPTCLEYDQSGCLLAWGLDAVHYGFSETVFTCEGFKVFLEPRNLRDPAAVDPRLARLPPKKDPKDLIVDYLTGLFDSAKQKIAKETGMAGNLDSAEIWLTFPALWDKMGCGIMRDAAIAAGMVKMTHAQDCGWRERLHIIPEPEAAFVHYVTLNDIHDLKPSETFMICDAGGGTVDLATYKVIGDPNNLELAKIYMRSGENSGSIFLDLRFRELVQTLLVDYPVHLEPASLAFFSHCFAESEKLHFCGEGEDDQYFYFNCFNAGERDDPSIGLINGKLAIPGSLLRRQVFDPVIDEILAQLDDQIRRGSCAIDALLLVGGFSENPYLFKRVFERFRDYIPVITKLDDADIATLQGAAKYGLSVRPPVSSVVALRSYLIKVKLPAEKEDEIMRPAYIRRNAVGALECENRVERLVLKGAILRNGQRFISKFSKYSASSTDQTFEAILYTSNSDKVPRYTGEGSISELCRWNVDLSKLRLFRENCRAHPGGFFTDFELMLEVDSAEIRWSLLQDGKEVSHLVLDSS